MNKKAAFDILVEIILWIFFSLVAVASLGYLIKIITSG